MVVIRTSSITWMPLFAADVEPTYGTVLVGSHCVHTSQVLAGSSHGPMEWFVDQADVGLSSG